MIPSILLLIGGLVFLTVGAEGLVRGGSALALRLRIAPVVVGLTVVAFGTSAPELAVSFRSALAGQGDIAVGNVVGSNIFNIAMILGLSAMICPLAVHIDLIRRDIPLMIAVTGFGWWLLRDQQISRLEGALLVAALITYMAVMIVQSRRRGLAEAGAEEALAELPKPSASVWLEVVMIVAGLGLLVFGADWFISGAVALARRAGLSEAVIGITIVAAGTSLPELATSVVAAARKHADIAVGNVVGSNIFNLLGILGLPAMVKPFSAFGMVTTDFLVMAVTAVVLFPLAATGFTLKRWEGALLFAGYVAYTAYRVTG
ncbi:MAG TPA: calcium/sodium antiporter [Kiritimatiellia bacterium]|nr:calcium/sodium antiporter [Kiritimatiellia bacterium]HMP00515.1 calcium/sodium antiporter [Kiritimatiellia bacterium]HMP97621.1 calcium/sodium antiporter [Kiritimatiellia bacterium]